MENELIEKCRDIINEQIIDWACKEGMTQDLLDGIIREELIPIIQKAERERILRLLLDPAWKLLCEDNSEACSGCKGFYQALKGETNDTGK